MERHESYLHGTCRHEPLPETWEAYLAMLADPASRCSLEEVLAAREKRAERQRAMLAEGPGALVCLALNVPGAVKQFPLARQSFGEACRLFGRRLAGAGLEAECRPALHAKTGSEACWTVRAPAVLVKRMAVAVEEGLPLGRLFDIDVLTPSGEKLSRG
ncbi:MAG: citrate lyase holo-[Desulfovibrio sp.]|nr:citrate lyase holo-[acyl-carrier protein] synthase [Desulfovibrio sp.]